MTAIPYTPAKQAARRSPNRQRLIARVAVWTVMLSGAVFVLPHFML